MSDVTLDTKAFFKRAGKIFAAYESPTPETADMADMAAIQVIMGEPNDDGLSYSKSSAMQVGASYVYLWKAEPVWSMKARRRVEEAESKDRRKEGARADI
jgi:hypothetical protein